MRYLALLALFAISLAQAEPGTLLKDTELRAKPFGDAEVVAQLKAKDSIDVLSRKGAWASVKAGGKSGWVRLLTLRTGSGQRGDAGVGALAAVFRTGSSGNTVSTGVKGLSEEKLQNAQPNAEEAQRLDRYRQSEGNARSFAKQAKLSAQKLDYLTPGNGGNAE